jgi:hypothetical protein
LVVGVKARGGNRGLSKLSAATPYYEARLAPVRRVSGLCRHGYVVHLENDVQKVNPGA